MPLRRKLGKPCSDKLPIDERRIEAPTTPPMLQELSSAAAARWKPTLFTAVQELAGYRLGDTRAGNRAGAGEAMGAAGRLFFMPMAHYLARPFPRA
jgi:hypothetical protein